MRISAWQHHHHNNLSISSKTMYHINFQHYHHSQTTALVLIIYNWCTGDKSCNKKWPRHQKTATNFLWPAPIPNRVISHNCNYLLLSWHTKKATIMMTLVMTWQWQLLVPAWGQPCLAQRQGGVSTAQPCHHINEDFDDLMMIIVIIKDYTRKQPFLKAFIQLWWGFYW